MKIINKIHSLLSDFLSVIHTFILCMRSDISIGYGSRVYWRTGVNIIRGGALKIGEFSAIGRSAKGYHCGMPFHTTVLIDGDMDSVVSIGARCRINGAYIHARSSITIGNGCVIASGVNILDSNGHVTISNDRTSGTDSSEPIVVGNNVWIGMNSTILKGSLIPDNCVVAVGSVVRGVFPENSLISGNPALVVKKLDVKTT